MKRSFITQLFLSFAAMALLAMPSFASVGLVNIRNQSASGTTIFQRNAENSTYSVNISLSTLDAVSISAMEANVTYDNTVFSDMTLTDANAGGSIWETSVVNANYSTNGTTTTVKFMKASTNGDSWALAGGQTPVLYTLTFRVKNNAAVGTTKIEFDANYAKVQEAELGNITNALVNTTYTIALDQTAPTTSVVNGNVGGYYKAPVTVLLDTNETNDEATINYTTDGSIPNFTSGYYIRSSGNVTIPSGNNTLVITTLNYLSRDWAQDKAANEEATVKTQVYYVDTQLPVISNVSYTAGPLATGYYAYVTFNVADNSNLLNGDPVVSFTGGTATKVSGSGVGQFVYRKQIASGDNDGTNHVDISITATDMAGNQDVNSISDAIALDFGAPSFTVTANPNPAAFLTWVTINVTASETLESPGYPSVVVSPGNPANYYASNGTSSTFRYFVTGNGWTAVVPWLNSGSFGDETAPQVMAIVPTSGATAVSITSDIVLRITDNITVVTGSVRITINNELAVAGGAGLSPTYSAFAMSVNNDGVVAITLNPSVNFVPLSRVTVNVSVLDNAGNNSVYTYVFDTKAAGVHNVSYTPNRHYNEIQSALDDAAVNQIIELDAGTYDQGVTINWPNTTGLTIRGASGTTSANVIISGGKAHRIFDMDESVSLSMSGMSIVNGYVSENTGKGAAFYCTPNRCMTINITNVIISGNIATGNNSSGGVFYVTNLLYSNSVNILINSSLINNNQANSGGVACGGVFIVNNNNFKGNNAYEVGGVGVNGCWNASNNTFTGNSARSAGGVALFGKWVINNNVFIGNTALSDGGVMCGTYVTADNNTFAGNNATAAGGVAMNGLWVANNNIFSGNSAKYGGVAAAGADMWKITNCTIFNNSANIGAVAFNASWNVSNTIFWGNKENNVTKNDFESCFAVTLSYCSMSTANWSSGNTTVVTNNLIIGDPKFQSTNTANAKFLQLAYGSPCIDTGTSNTTVTNDIRGYVRPLGYGYDMGAYEYEELFLSEFAPAKTSTRNANNANIVFRVRDYLHPSANISLGITVNGTSTTNYTRATDNSTSGSSDFYAVFDVADFTSFSTVNVTVNAKCASLNVQDAYYFRTLDITAPTINVVAPTNAATLISITSNISFKFTDTYSVIPTETLQVTINGHAAVVNGVGMAPTYSNGITFGAITGGYSVTIDPSINFVPLTRVTVDVSIQDNEGNPASLTYYFNTKAASVNNVSYAPSRWYNEIQSALDDAQEGQTIELLSGIYNQGVTINWPNTDGLTIRGASGTTSANVIISGGKVHRIFDMDETVSLSMSGFSIMDGFVSGNHGGAFYCSPNLAMTVNITNMIISGNIATGNTSLGGAFYTGSANVYVVSSLIRKNQAGYGGGFASHGTWSLSNTYIIDNSSVSFGGVGCYGVWTVQNNTFINNRGGYGTVGAMGDWYANNNIFTANISSYYAGVMFSVNMYARMNMFSENSAAQYGGVAAGGTWVESNNVFSRNSAVRGGVAVGGAMNWTGYNSTFMGNSATYGSVFMGSGGGTWTGTNEIFWGNKENGVTKNDFVSCTSVTLSYCSMSTANWSSGNTTVATNDLIIGDPKFQSTVSTNAKFLQLMYSSPCRDTGTDNVTVTDDILGIARPQYAGFDMGAYEYNDFVLTEFSPAKASTHNAINTNIVFRVTDPLHPSSSISLGITVNGTGTTNYTRVSDNSTALAADFYAVFNYPDFSSYTTVNVTVNAKCASSNAQDAYQFWTTDVTPPTINVVAPTNAATLISITSNISFKITDTYSAIPTETLQVTINGHAAVVDGVGVAPTYSNAVSFGTIATGFSVTIDPLINFVPLTRVTVNVSIRDAEGNSAAYTYYFNTKAASVNNVSYAPSRWYNEIQSALDDATSNQVIELLAGKYDQGVTINWPNTDGLTIRGATGTTSANVIISGGKVHRVFYVAYNTITSMTFSDMTISDGFISQNYAGGAGIAFKTSGLVCTVNLTNMIISGNVVTGSIGQTGGFLGVIGYSTLNVVADSIFAKNNDAIGGWGSVFGLSNTGGPAFIGQITNSVFSNNAGGGGVLYGGKWRVSNTTFNNNWGYYAAIMRSGELIADNCTFLRNSCFSGGAITDGSDCTVNACSVFSNYSSGSGGSGAGVAYGGHWAVLNSVFYDNKSVVGGPGISWASTWKVENCVFYSNSSTSIGGVAYVSTWNVSNTIFYGNKNASLERFDFNTCCVTLNDCLVGTSSYSTTSVISTENVIIGNPLFQSMASANVKFLQLAYGSPCIDTGTSNTTVTDDIRGYARPLGYGYDMGAYEYEELFLSEFTPVKSSTMNYQVTENIVFRVRDYLHASANISLGITLNGVSYASYTRATDNSTAGSTDFYAVFDVNDLPYGSTVNVTVNAKCSGVTLQDKYYFFERDYFPPAINPITPLAEATLVSITNNIVIRITDNIQIATASLQVTVNGLPAVINGVGVPVTYSSVVYGVITSGNIVTIDPSINFEPSSRVTVDVAVSDREGNTVYLTYGFNTAVAGVHNISYVPNRHYNEIQTALTDALADHVIVLDAGTYDQGVTINWPNTNGLTLRGADGTNSANVIISGGNRHPGFTVANAVSLSISGLTAMRTSGNDTVGGVFYCPPNIVSTFNISNVIMVGNYAGVGAIMRVPSSSVTMIDSLFNNNVAVLGGVINVDKGVIENCIVTGNTAGWIGAFAYMGNWTMNNTTFAGNSAGLGGAVMGGVIGSINNCMFLNNTATAGDGGVMHACIVTVNESAFSGNIASKNGGVASACSINIQNCTFTDNSAVTGGVFVASSGNIMNSTFFNNKAKTFAGVAAYGALTGVNSVFWNNKENNLLRNDFRAGRITLNYCALSTINYVTGATAISTGNLLYGDPGFASEVSADALYLQPAVLSPLINAGTNSGAPTTDILGVDRPQGGIVDIGAYEWTGTFDGSNFRAHNLNTDIYYNRVETALNGTSADGQTIELYAYTNKEPEIKWPSRNSITLRGASGTNSANVVMSGDKKNRIFMIDKPVSLSILGMSLVDGYVSGNNGGAIYCSSNVIATINIVNAIVSGNTNYQFASSAGGAFYAPNSIFFIDGSLIRNNIAHFGGVARDGTFIVNNSSFIENRGFGTVLIWQVDHYIWDNTYCYGGVAYGGKWTVSNCIVSGNSTGFSGGVAQSSSWNVSNTVFKNNSGVSYGGIAANSFITANNCNFSGNTAGSGGVASGGVWSVDNSIFSQNTAFSGTGGVALNSKWSVNNSIFSLNQAKTIGGLAYNSPWVVNNATIYMSSANIAAVAYSSTWSATNTIFWNNMENTQIKNDFVSCSVVTLSYCSVSTVNFASANTTLVTRDLLVGDPQFQSTVLTDAKFLRLSFGSLAVNSGTSNVSVTTDMSGTPRGLYGAYDLGAYEYDNIFLSEYSPVKSSTSNVVDSKLRMRVQDYAHQSSAVALTLNVNGTPRTDWTVGTTNSTTTTDMYIVLDLSTLAYGATINVTVNGQCPSINMFNDVYWFTIDIPPVITPYDPTANATMVMPWVTVVFDVTDNMTVSVSSVMVTFNRTEGTQLAVNNGTSGVSYNVGLNPIANGYRVSINHDIRFALAETVTVSILAKDNNGNPTTISYVFQIIDDFTAPSAAYNVRAVASPNVRVELSWQHPQQGDVAMFRVYRVQSTAPAGEGVEVGTTNGTVMTYNDTTVATPNSYYYYVKAEDVYWNEGDKSNYAGAPHIKVTSRNYTVQSPNGYSGAGADLVPGAKVSFITKLMNDGYSPATATEFKDAIPAHTHYVTGSVYCSDTATINFQHEAGGAFDADENTDATQLRWQLPNMIEPFQERAVSFSVTVD